MISSRDKNAIMYVLSLKLYYFSTQSPETSINLVKCVSEGLRRYVNKCVTFSVSRLSTWKAILLPSTTFHQLSSVKFFASCVIVLVFDSHWKRTTKWNLLKMETEYISCQRKPLPYSQISCNTFYKLSWISVANKPSKTEYQITKRTTDWAILTLHEQLFHTISWQNRMNFDKAYWTMTLEETWTSARSYCEVY